MSCFIGSEFWCIVIYSKHFVYWLFKAILMQLFTSRWALFCDKNCEKKIRFYKYIYIGAQLLIKNLFSNHNLDELMMIYIKPGNTTFSSLQKPGYSHVLKGSEVVNMTRKGSRKISSFRTTNRGRGKGRTTMKNNSVWSSTKKFRKECEHQAQGGGGG